GVKISILFRRGAWAPVAFLLVFVSSLGAQGRYETPDLPELQPVIERFRADWPVLSKPTYLAEPKGIAWPVEVSQEDQYRWFGLYMALPEESRKVMRSSRRLFREMGMDPSTLGQMEYSNIRI